KPEGEFLYFLSNAQWLTALGGAAADHSKTLLAAVGEALNASSPTPDGSAAAPELALHASPSQAAAHNAPPPPNLAPPRPAQAIETGSSASPSTPSTPLTGRPVFWLLIAVVVVVVAAVSWFLGGSSHTTEEQP